MGRGFKIYSSIHSLKYARNVSKSNVSLLVLICKYRRHSLETDNDFKVDNSVICDIHARRLREVFSLPRFYLSA